MLVNGTNPLPPPALPLPDPCRSGHGAKHGQRFDAETIPIMGIAFKMARTALRVAEP